MSMLAGPRRKQKVINLRAKNNLWSNDSNKFGQRMLEKMGWSSGKGLGAHENGIVEHVVAKYKNDDRGLGFEDRNDQWTKHEDDFNSLLANLSNSETNTENVPSGISLEVKSKKSKARIHYHKFTRGKDLSRYSEKDLANIFGKKSFKEETVEEPLKDDVKASEQVFTEKGSMDDYFKNKLASLKLKSKLFSKDRNEDEETTEYGFQGFSSTVSPGEHESNDNSSNGFQPFSFYGTQSNYEINTKPIPTSEEFTNESEQVIKKKKKKKSKCQDAITIQENCIELQESNELSELTTDQELVPSEGRKSKKKMQDVNCDVIDNIHIKKKKNKKSQEHSEALQDQSECVDNNMPKKKKKRKNKDK